MLASRRYPRRGYMIAQARRSSITGHYRNYINLKKIIAGKGSLNRSVKCLRSRLDLAI
jgi:hypothetical protein